MKSRQNTETSRGDESQVRVEVARTAPRVVLGYVWPPALVPLIAVYPVAFLASANVGQVSMGSFATCAFASSAVAVLVWAILLHVCRDRHAAALGAGLVMVMFYTFGQAQQPAQQLVESWYSNRGRASEFLKMSGSLSVTWAWAWLVLAAASALAISRSTFARSPVLGHALAVAIAALVVLSGLRVITTLRHPPGTESVSESLTAKLELAGSRSQLPDIYYVVFDGYARADVLRQYYGFDNSPFIDALKTRGFRVPLDTSANYGWTFLSLASTLNLDYLHSAMPEVLKPNSKDRREIYDRIRDSRLSRLLRTKGYEIVHFQSTWGATADNPHADRQVTCEQAVYANEFYRTVVEMSWLRAFAEDVSVGLADCHLANFATLAEEGAKGGPKFVFVHFILPHHPYLFDGDGTILSDATISNQFDFQKKLWEDRGSYTAQLEFVNSAALRAIDGLLASSKARPIIVLASDHGPNLEVNLTRNERVAVRLASFGAYLLPDAPADLIPDSTSAVNQFRLILSHYLGLNLPPLPDRHFVSPYRNPYRLSEVSRETLVSQWHESGLRRAGASVVPVAELPHL